MKYKTILALTMAAALAVGCLSGCSTTSKPETAAATTVAQTTTEQTATNVPETPSAQTNSATLRIGKVTAVEGTSVTLALSTEHMEMQQMPGGKNGLGRDGQMPGRPGDQGQPPEQSAGDNAQPGGMTPPSGQPGEIGQPPEMPDGESGQTVDGTGSASVPAPNGQNEQPDGMPGGKHDQNGQMGGKGGFDPDGMTFGDEILTVTLEENLASGLSAGDYMMVFFDETGEYVSAEPFGRMGGPNSMDGHMGRPDSMGGPGGMGGQMGDPGGMGNAASSGTAANTATEDRSGETFTSENADENALRVDGGTVTLTDLTLTKTGDGSSTEACDFYGVNAGLLATNGANVTVEGGSFTTDAAGGNALFSYGTGTTLTVKNATIRTSSNNSGGIQTTGGATTVAENLDVETSGASAAAIRSDRGGGTVTVNGGTYVTHGTGSPAIYCTADITVQDATLTATASEGVVVEGKNSVTLQNCTLSGNMQGTYGKTSSENLQAVMIYQSMSGDASVGKGSFSMTGGSLTVEAGDAFYVTNTSAEITLSGVELALANDVLLRVAGNDGSRGWGATGSNGGSVTMTAEDQALMGDILVDEISTLDLSLTDGSTWTGSVNPDGAAGRVSLKLAEGCTWKLTADAYVSAFDGDLDSVDTNGFHLYVGGKLAK